MANSIAKLEKALRRDPDSPRFALLADLYLKRGRIERAIELCQKGCASFPDYATGFIVLSKCYEKRGDLEQAREAIGQALRIDPENPSGYKRLAHLFEQLDVAPLALQSLRQAAYFDPFDTSLAEQIDRFTSQTHQKAPVPESEPKPESEPPNLNPKRSRPSLARLWSNPLSPKRCRQTSRPMTTATTCTATPTTANCSASCRRSKRRKPPNQRQRPHQKSHPPQPTTSQAQRKTSVLPP